MIDDDYAKQIAKQLAKRPIDLELKDFRVRREQVEPDMVYTVGTIVWWPTCPGAPGVPDWLEAV